MLPILLPPVNKFQVTRALALAAVLVCKGGRQKGLHSEGGPLGTPKENWDL